MLATTLGNFLTTYGLFAIFAVMLLKESGIPLPVPSDLVMITAGVQAATGVYNIFQVLIAVEIALIVGGSIQFLLARSVGRQVVYRLGRFVELSQAKLDAAGARLQRRGRLAIVVGINLPGARAAIIPSAGLSGMAYRVFAPAIILGSSLFYGWHIALGFVIGPSAATLLNHLNVPLLPLFLGLALLGLVVWLVLRRRRKAAAAMPAASTLERLHAWSEAACPACLAVAAFERFSAPTPDEVAP
jgi:membrane protein DedA with SNARE-associated domain